MPNRSVTRGAEQGAGEFPGRPIDQLFIAAWTECKSYADVARRLNLPATADQLSGLARRFRQRGVPLGLVPGG